MLAIEYHVHIWPVPLQLSCGDTCKYESDAKNLIGTLAGSKILLTEKIKNRALVTPTPDWWSAILLLGLHNFISEC